MSSTNDADVIFNHLLNYNFDAKDFKFEDQQLFHPTDQFPILFLQIYSYSSPSSVGGRRRRLLGYGSLQFPLTAGDFEFSVKIWKPMGSIRHQLHELFVGDAITLKDNAFPRDFDTLTKSLNRFGVLTQSMGEITVRGSIVVTDYRPVAARLRAETEGGVPSGPASAMSKKQQERNQRLNSFKMRKSVEEIMRSFKDARTQAASKEGKPATDKAPGGLGRLTASTILSRLRADREAKAGMVSDGIASRDSGPVPQGTSRPSIRSILDTINANVKSSKVVEMPQRVKDSKKKDSSSTEKTTDNAQRTPRVLKEEEGEDEDEKDRLKLAERKALLDPSRYQDDDKDEKRANEEDDAETSQLLR